MGSHLKVNTEGGSVSGTTAAADTPGDGSAALERADHQSAAMRRNAGPLGRQAESCIGLGKLPGPSPQPRPSNGGLEHPDATLACLPSATHRGGQKPATPDLGGASGSASPGAVRAQAEPARRPHADEVAACGVTSGGTTMPAHLPCRDARAARRHGYSPATRSTASLNYGAGRTEDRAWSR